MKHSVYHITLDMQKSHSPVAVAVNRGETRRKLHIRLTEGGKPYYPDPDCYGVFTAQKPDGTVLYNACTREGDDFLYEITSQTTALPGQLDCQLRLYGAENALLASAAFLLVISDTVYTEGEAAITSSGEATALTRLITQATEKLTQMDFALEYGRASVVVDVGEGNPVTLEHSLNYPIQSLKCYYTAIQEGEGTPSNENVRPITSNGAANCTLTIGDTLLTSGALPAVKYGGYIDWLRGKYVKTHEYILVDGTVDHFGTTGDGRFYIYDIIPVSNKSQGTLGNLQSTGMCDRFAYGTQVYTAATHVWFSNVPFKTPNELREYLLKNPIQVVYPLSAPVEYPITEMPTQKLLTTYPQTVLSGDNNGNLEIYYGIEAKTYIDKKFDQLATAIVANS